MFYLIISLGTALALFVLMIKIGLKKVLGYDIYVDLICTFFLMYLFRDSVTGLIVAVMGGLALSVMLMFCKAMIGYSRFEEIPGTEEEDWVDYPPIWKWW